MSAGASTKPSRRGRARGIVSFASVIRLWPSYAVLADDCGVSYQTVASWRRRSSIPQNHWEQIERSARKHRIHGITYDYLRSVAAHGR
jgi:hypothetical protein